MQAERRASSVLAVIVHFNHLHLTEACLRALRQQTHPVDVIIVDNGSTNSSAEELRRRLSGCERLVEMGTRAGFGEAINRGVAAAVAEGYRHALLLGNDTEMSPDVVELLATAAEGNLHLGAVAPIQVSASAPHIVYTAGGRLDRHNWKVHHMGTGEPLALVQQVPLPDPDWLDFAAVLIPIAVWTRVGPLDTRYGYYWEDVDWCLRCRVLGYALGVLRTATIRHHVSATARERGTMSGYLSVRNRLECARKVRGRVFAMRLAARNITTVTREAIRPGGRVNATVLAATVDFLRRRVRTY